MLDIPPEFLRAIQKVHEFGQAKYGKEPDGDPNWLAPSAIKTDHKNMLASIFRHVAEMSSRKTEDHESGLPPAYHAAYRLMMYITRMERGIIHPLDKEKTNEKN